MRTLPHSQPGDSAGIKCMIQAGAGEILRRWEESVRAEQVAPAYSSFVAATSRARSYRNTRDENDGHESRGREALRRQLPSRSHTA